MQKSPLAPAVIPQAHPIKGVEISAIEANIKYKNRTDLVLFKLAENTNVAGVFTKSKCASAPVDWCKAALKENKGENVRGMIINSGNANAFTGSQGQNCAQIMAQMSADIIGCEDHQVMVASTGVIGEQIDNTIVLNSKEKIIQNFANQNDLGDGAEAIMTTDTFPKVSTVKTTIQGEEVSISGIAKGSGMIAPDMATMLGFIFTDANIPQSLLQSILSKLTETTFNSITVDSDTSTSDTVLLAATCQANNKVPVSEEECEEFIAALHQLMNDLAVQIVKDGEGASKLIEIDVTGAVSDESAKTIALSIANSPLVKTAIAGEDANWGRIIMAVGKAGEPADRDILKVAMDNVVICEKGNAVLDYDEAKLTEHLKGQEVTIQVDIGLGEGKAKVWTCDFTEGYIRINADYRS